MQNRFVNTVCVLVVVASATLSGASGLRQSGPEGFPGFVDVAAEVGVTGRNVSGGPAKDYIIEATGSGAGFFDYDLDGDIDIVLTNGSTLESYRTGGDPMAALYRNDDGRFTDVTSAAGLTSSGWGMGLCIADVDNDGDRDLYLTAWGPNVLYQNNGDGTFDDISDSALVADSRWGYQLCVRRLRSGR